MDKIVVRKTEIAEDRSANPAAPVPALDCASDKIVLRGTEVPLTSDLGASKSRFPGQISEVVVRNSELSEDSKAASEAWLPRGEMTSGASQHQPSVPRNVNFALWLLTPFLPVLCLVALAVRLVLRDEPEWTRLGWLKQLNSRLIAGGLLWALLALVIGVWPRSAPPSERPVSHAVLPRPSTGVPSGEVAPSKSGRDVAFEGAELTKPELFARFEPLTLIVRQGDSHGAGVILESGPRGTLIGTARHVVGKMDGSGNELLGRTILVESRQHKLSKARVVGVHRDLDLALLWVGDAILEREICLPIRLVSSIKVGEDVQAIGHPESLNQFSFSLAPGTVSRDVGNDGLIHITAPLWHGFSGGPIVDVHGNLMGISHAIVGARTRGVEVPVPGLGFATTAEPFLKIDEWFLNQAGAEWLNDFAAKSQRLTVPVRAEPQNDIRPTGTASQ